MCVKEFDGFWCGHCSFPTLRPCPLTLANEYFVPCSILAERPTFILGYCPACARVEWNRKVLELEEQHKERHKGGDYCCDTIFSPAEREIRETMKNTGTVDVVTTDSKNSQQVSRMLDHVQDYGSHRSVKHAASHFRNEHDRTKDSSATKNTATKWSRQKRQHRSYKADNYPQRAAVASHATPENNSHMTGSFHAPPQHQSPMGIHTPLPQYSNNPYIGMVPLDPQQQAYHLQQSQPTGTQRFTFAPFAPIYTQAHEQVASPTRLHTTHPALLAAEAQSFTPGTMHADQDQGPKSMPRSLPPLPPMLRQQHRQHHSRLPQYVNFQNDPFERPSSEPSRRRKKLVSPRTTTGSQSESTSESGENKGRETRARSAQKAKNKPTGRREQQGQKSPRDDASMHKDRA